MSFNKRILKTELDAQMFFLYFVSLVSTLKGTMKFFRPAFLTFQFLKKLVPN